MQSPGSDRREGTKLSDAATQTSTSPGSPARVPGKAAAPHRTVETTVRISKTRACLGLAIEGGADTGNHWCFKLSIYLKVRNHGEGKALVGLVESNFYRFHI